MPGGGTQCWTRQPGPFLGELISQLRGGGWGPFGHVIGEETDNRNGDAMVGEQKVWRRQLWTGCSPDVIPQWWAMSRGLKESGSWPNRPQAEGTYKGKAPEVKARKGTKFGCRVVGEGERAAARHWWGSRASHRVLDAKIRMLLRRGTQLQRCYHLRSPFPGPRLTISFFPAALPVSLWDPGFLNSGALVPGPLMGHLPTASWLRNRELPRLWLSI